MDHPSKSNPTINVDGFVFWNVPPPRMNEVYAHLSSLLPSKCVAIMHVRHNFNCPSIEKGGMPDCTCKKVDLEIEVDGGVEVDASLASYIIKEGN